MKLAHLLRCCDELLETATSGAIRFSRRIDELLHRALDTSATTRHPQQRKAQGRRS
jgi:hypothetical protein